MKNGKTPSPKLGSQHAGAMFRMGLSELRNAVFPESNVAEKHAEHGVWGTRTPGEVAQARKDEVRDLNEEPIPAVESRIKRAEHSRDERGRGTRGLERE